MILRVVIIACFAILYFPYVKCFNDFFKKYDIVNFEILDLEIRRTSIENTYLNESENEVDLQIRFRTFKKNFHLFLHQDESFPEIPVAAHIASGLLNKTNSTIQAKFYDGYLIDNVLNSSVIAYIFDGLFTGKISDGNVIYFVEPAIAYFDNIDSDSQKIVVYRDSDLRSLPWEIIPRPLFNNSDEVLPLRALDTSVNVTQEDSSSVASNGTVGLTCEIEIVADHTLYNFYDNDTNRLAAVLYFHAKFADYVFRRADFDMDGNPDGIRIAVGKISIYKSAEDDNYPMLGASSLSDYMILFLSRKQDNEFCLSIGMFYRKYIGMAVGEAIKAETQFNNTFGGICDPPMSHFDSLGSLFYNTGVLNMQFQNGKPLPLAVTLLAFTHEIGHGFGSDHDPLNDPICSPGKQENYLMYAFSSHGSRNALKFSNCSRISIRKVIAAKGTCLKLTVPTCGNTIREGYEQCDCGPEMFCNLIDPCCTPSDAKAPEVRCSIRTVRNFTCSYKEDECCNEQCHIITDPQTICYRDEVECLYSFCDGKSAACPKPQKMIDRCKPSFTCDNETCSNSTLCVSQGLTDCFCTRNISSLCLQCCQKDNHCVPASDLGLFNSSGGPYILKPGTICNEEGEYYCDNDGKCVINIIFLYTSSELYVGVIIFPFFVSIVLLLAMFISCQKGTANTAVRIESDL